MAAPSAAPPNPNSTRRILLASLAGTTIEFYDFYIYATAAVLVFPRLFFPGSDPAAAMLQSFATFGIAFVARPVGSVLFGHFGDRIGRKATLVAALLTMGTATAAIGLLPTYAAIGPAAAGLLALCRFGQGFGLGGEWGGAVLLATENAPPGRRGWFGMFPQLGAPLGFFASGVTFLGLTWLMPNAQFLAYGWRIPFLLSSVLVLFGLYVRLRVTETPAFLAAMSRRERVAVPIADVFLKHGRALVLGTLIALSAFVLFYILTVFCLSWGTGPFHFTRTRFLIIQLVGVLFFALTIPWSARLIDRHGRRRVLLIILSATAAYGLGFGLLFNGQPGSTTAALILGFALMGLGYGPLGTLLSELFPTAVRYTGASMAFNLAGIFGASLAPYLATSLAVRYGISAVGYYLAVATALSCLALYASGETAEDSPIR